MLSEAELPGAKKDCPTVNNTSSSMIKSMWEHAVTFMRGALDAIMFDRSKAGSVVTTPITSDGVCQQGSPDPVFTQPPASEAKVVTYSDDSSGTDCLKQTPPTPGTCSISCTPLKHPLSIKHPALKRYYEESPESLVQNTKSFSFLLKERAKVAADGLNSIPELETSITTPTHQKLPESQSSVVPAPPPLPPVVPTPPPLPPATPTLMESDGLAPPSDKYTVVLHSIQNRLQKRIKNRGVAVENEEQKATDVSVKVLHFYTVS